MTFGGGTRKRSVQANGQGIDPSRRSRNAHLRSLQEALLHPLRGARCSLLQRGPRHRLRRRRPRVRTRAPHRQRSHRHRVKGRGRRSRLQTPFPHRLPATYATTARCPRHPCQKDSCATTRPPAQSHQSRAHRNDPGGRGRRALLTECPALVLVQITALDRLRGVREVAHLLLSERDDRPGQRARLRQ